MSVAVKAQGSFEPLLKKLQNPTPLLHSIGQYLVSTTQARIRTTKTSPDGTPWKSWSPATAAARAKAGTTGGGLLFNSGSLFNSISYQVQGKEVAVGTGNPYAAYLQLGTSRMPARPFLGISKLDGDAISGLVRRHLRA